jgi:DHA1 family tetracycline resistance protein-like MFS transporter
MQAGSKTGRMDRSAAMPFIMLTVLLDMVSLGLIIPVLPALVGSFTHSQSEQVFWYGALMFAFACSNFIASPILGRLSDAYGRRPVLLLGFCGLALNFFATAMATALWMLLLVRLIGGMMQANMAVANAYVADITPAAQRARRFGMLGAMFGLGFIVGPMLGGVLGAINLRLPFFLAGSLALLNLLYGYFVLPESLPRSTRQRFHWSAANPLTTLRELGQMGSLRPLMLVIACGSLAQFVMFSIWVLYCSQKFGWGPTENGWSLAASGLISVLVQGLLLGRLLRSFSPRRLAVAGMLSASLAYLFWGAATQGWMMYLIVALNLLGTSVNACVQSIISAAADAHNQGRAMGAVSSINSLAAVMGPLIGAPLLGLVAHLPRGDWRIGAPLYFCALLQLLGLLLAIAYFRQPHSKAVRAD